MAHLDFPDGLSNLPPCLSEDNHRGPAVGRIRLARAPAALLQTIDNVGGRPRCIRSRSDNSPSRSEPWWRSIRSARAWDGATPKGAIPCEDPFLSWRDTAQKRSSKFSSATGIGYQVCLL